MGKGQLLDWFLATPVGKIPESTRYPGSRAGGLCKNRPIFKA